MVEVHGLIPFRDVAKEAAALAVSLVIGPDPGRRSRRATRVSPVFFAPEIQPVRCSTDKSRVTDPARAVDLWTCLMRRGRPIPAASIRGSVLKRREGEVPCMPA